MSFYIQTIFNEQGRVHNGFTCVLVGMGNNASYGVNSHCVTNRQNHPPSDPQTTDLTWSFVHKTNLSV